MSTDSEKTKPTGTNGYIFAVHDSDLDSFLSDLSLLKKLNTEGIPCNFCEKLVYKHNLGYIYFIGGKEKVCCDKISCYYDLLKLRGNN
ncbi:hypothetical protein ACFLQ6_00185 [Thermoproteota archaeon]